MTAAWNRSTAVCERCLIDAMIFRPEKDDEGRKYTHYVCKYCGAEYEIEDNGGDE